MMLFLMATALFGCTSAEGTWAGTCEGSGYTVDSTLDITDDKGGDLTGTFSVTNSGMTLTGDATGTRDHTTIDLDIDVTNSGYTIPTTFSGEMTGNDLAGDWVIAYGGSSQSYACTFARE